MDPDPSNATIANTLVLLADLMTIDGANHYRVRAYRRAAERIRAHPEPVATMARRGMATRIDGVGDGIQAAIVDLADTGTTAVLDDVRKRVPDGVADIARLNGVGPVRAKAIAAHLGVTDLDGLRQHAAAGELETVPGIGPTITADIIRQLTDSHRDQVARPRVDYARAREVADNLVEVIQEHPDTVDVQIAGSLRRGREDVGDIDVVVATENTDGVFDRIAASGAVVQVTARGPRRMRVETQQGIVAEFHTGDPAAFGNLIQHATGSASHNTRLRERAVRAGYSLSEHGWQGPDGTVVCTTDENHVYELLGLAAPPPELREDTGEFIEIGQDVPTLVSEADVRGQIHVHSIWSDGSASIGQIAEAARLRGDSYIGVSDHSQTLAMARGLTPDRVRRQWAEIDGLNARFDDSFRILKCIEVDILTDGRLDYPDELLEGFDVVIASIHSGFRQSPAQITQRLLRAISSPHVDVIGHPTGCKRGSREAVPIDLDAVVLAAAKTGTALEINGQPSRQDLDSAMARRARDAGVRLLLSSDAHSVEGLDLIAHAVRIARRAGATRNDIVNTAHWPWPGFPR